MKNDFSKRKLINYLREDELIHLSTISPRGEPHVVPVWFVYRDERVGEPRPRVYVLTDKRTAKVANISRNPNVSFEIDNYDDNMEWNVRGAMFRGRATLVEDDGDICFYEFLIGEKYPVYWKYPWDPKERAVIRIDLEKYSSWNVLPKDTKII